MRHLEVALARAKEFIDEGKGPVRIARAKRKTDFVILFPGQEPTSNYEVLFALGEDNQEKGKV